jgi:hypothetical protein
VDYLTEAGVRGMRDEHGRAGREYELKLGRRLSSEGVISVEAPPMKETIRPFRSFVAGTAPPG